MRLKRLYEQFFNPNGEARKVVLQEVDYEKKFLTEEFNGTQARKEIIRIIRNVAILKTAYRLGARSICIKLIDRTLDLLEKNPDTTIKIDLLRVKLNHALKYENDLNSSREIQDEIQTLKKVLIAEVETDISYAYISNLIEYKNTFEIPDYPDCDGLLHKSVFLARNYFMIKIKECLLGYRYYEMEEYCLDAINFFKEYFPGYGTQIAQFRIKQFESFLYRHRLDDAMDILKECQKAKMGLNTAANLSQIAIKILLKKSDYSASDI